MRAPARRHPPLHVLGLRIHRAGPHLLPAHVRLAPEEVDDHRPRGLGEAHGLLEGALELPALGGVLPLAEDAREAAGVEQGAGGVADLGLVLAEVGVVHRAVGIAGPGQGFLHHPGQGEGFALRVAAVDVVQAQGARRGCR